MTATTRILLNTAVSYGRTLLSVAMGLFSSRWILQALGKDDFGIFGVVGGIIVFVSLLNGVLATAVSRYYAFAIGEAKMQPAEVARENLERWFNAALSIHWFLPIVLVAIGLPTGEYAIRHWFVVPEGRMSACIFIYKLSLACAFLQMVSVPYIAMYQAKQLIAELSLWSMITTFTNFGVSFFMLTYEGDRLVTYALLSAVAPSAIIIIQVLRARKCFGVCHCRACYMFDCQKLKQMFKFAFGDFFGWLGATIRDQGSVLVINRFFGTGLNASYSIANRVLSYVTSLSGALSGALQPAITTTLGEKNRELFSSLIFRSCKFTVLLVAFFAVPVFVEVDELLKLWLITPPEYTAELCQTILVGLVILKMGWGQHMAVLAVGKIVTFQLVLGMTAASGIAILAAMVSLGLGPKSVGYMLIMVFSLMTIERVLFARQLAGISVKKWIKEVAVPASCMIGVSVGGACLFASLFERSFLRLIGTTAVSSVVLCAGSWIFLLDKTEKEYILMFPKRLLNKARS